MYPSVKYDWYFSGLFSRAHSPPPSTGVFCLQGFLRPGDSVSVTCCERFHVDSTGCRTRPRADFYRSESPARRRDVSGRLFLHLRLLPPRRICDFDLLPPTLTLFSCDDYRVRDSTQLCSAFWPRSVTVCPASWGTPPHCFGLGFPHLC